MNLSDRHPPLEEIEQTMLAGWLDSRRCRGRRLLWMHVPNEGKRTPKAGAKLKRQGLKPGVPDNWILQSPPAMPSAIGVVFELKRRGVKYRKPNKDQQRWLDDLKAEDYHTFDARGFDDAKRKLEALGY